MHYFVASFVQHVTFISTRTNTTGFEMTTETNSARKLIKSIIDKGFIVRIHDGEGWTTKWTRKINSCIPVLGGTDEETIHVGKLNEDTAGAKHVGHIFLVYGNGVEDLICDYSSNETINAIVNEHSA